MRFKNYIIIIFFYYCKSKIIKTKQNLDSFIDIFFTVKIIMNQNYNKNKFKNIKDHLFCLSFFFKNLKIFKKILQFF